ncbi:MAG: epoxide hydrolase, partial [Chitinophagaceae bacterium]
MKKVFNIDISADVIADLHNRLKATRWIGEIDNKDWKAGTNNASLKELCEYWVDKFDWPMQQDSL